MRNEADQEDGEGLSMIEGGRIYSRFQIAVRECFPPQLKYTLPASCEIVSSRLAKISNDIRRIASAFLSQRSYTRQSGSIML